MNAQFQVAQATGTAIPTNTTPVRTFTLAKPLTDQAVVVHLGYDQKVKLDFSAIANEKITLVHVGEKLIILFDNKSTITVDPVFDSRHDDQHLLSIELAPGRDVNVQEFASLFPITTDQSVLPAAGDGNGNAQGSGANFSNAAVDTLNAGNPLDLLGQEQLGNFVLNPETFAGLPATTLPSAGFTLSDTIVIHDETVDVQILNGANDQPSAGLPAVFSAVGLIGWAQSAVSEIASSSAGFGSGGTGTIAYALTTSTGAAFAGVDSGLQATVTGNEIFLFTEGNLVVGREGAGGVADPNGAVAFQLYLDPASLKLDVAQYEAIKHGTASAPDTSEGAQLGHVVFVQQTVTDGSGNTATALSTGSLGVSFLDDGPTSLVTVADGSEGPTRLATLSLDESIASDRGANGFPDGTFDDVSGNTSPDPTGTHPIGTMKTDVGNVESPGDLAALFNVVKDGGTDTEKTTDYAYSFTLNAAGFSEESKGGIATTLKVTDPNHTYSDDTIYLFKVSDTEIVGHVGDDPNGPVAIRITLDNAGSLSGGQLVVDQYMAIDHGADLNNFDSTQFLNLVGEGASLGITLTATITDGDNDTATSSATIEIAGPQQSSIGFQDDGPSIDVTVHQPVEGSAHLATLSLDESIGGDRGANGLPDGTVDDVSGNTGPDPTGTNPIGELKTVAGEGELNGDLEALFDVTKIAGTDGEKSTDYAYSFALSGGKEAENGGIATTLKVTDPNHTYSDDTIYLFKVSDTEIVGHVGDDPNGPVAIRITLDNAGSLSGGQLVVDQYMAIDHGADLNNFDSTQFLNLVGEGASLGITLTATITDGDNDTATSSATIEIVGTEDSSISFQDDGPAVSVSANSTFQVVHDETLLLQSPPFGDDNDILFTPVFNGVSNPGHDPQVLFGLPIGYAQSNVAALTIDNVDFGTDGAAKTGAQLFSLTLTDAQGQSTTGPIDSNLATTEGKEIFLFLENGLIVGRYDGGDPGNDVTSTNDPAAFAIAIDPVNGKVSVVQYVSLHHNSADIGGDIDEAVSLAGALGQVKATVMVTDGDGDHASASANIGGGIQFEDDGPLVAATLSRNFGVTADETPGNQANDVTGPLQIFAGVQNPGVDPDEPGTPLAYATSSGAALSILPYFGVDGPDPAAAITYSLELKSSNSGVTLTDGTAISLSLDSAGRVIGTVGTDNVHPELSGTTAFAVAIDPLSGKVSVVEYLSLHHSDSSNPNDQVSLAAGSISAVVTIKDGDGDTASASADISSKIHFNDDGPALTIGTGVTTPELVALALNLDETIGHDGSPPDQYNLGEGESGGGVPNGTADDTGNATVTFTTDATSTAQIGELMTGAGLLAPLFTNAVIDYGADGPALVNPVTSALSLVLTGAPEAGGIKTNLVATALADSLLEGTSQEHRTVWLTIEGGQIVGRVGHDTLSTADDFVVLRISLNSTDPATAQLVVDQFLPIDHDASEPAGAQLPENPSLFDESISLLTAIAGQSVGVKLTVTVTDGDGDHVTKSATATVIDHSNSIVSIDDSGPTISASQDCVDTPLSYVGIKAGNVDERGLDGPSDQDVLMSGVGQGNSPNANTINTTGSDIGVGNQSIEGHEVHGGNDLAAEILRLDFVNNVTFPANTFAYNGHYEVDAASFTIHQIQGNPSNTATVFVQVFNANDNNDFTDDGNPLPITLNDVTVTGDASYTKIPVYDGNTLVGVVIVGLNEGATVTVDTSNDFNRLVISNYDNVAFSSTPNGAPTLPVDPNDSQELNVGHPFSVSGISSVVCAPATLSVTHDESAGFAPQSGPNPENDVDPATAPSVLTAAIAGAQIGTVLGYAESTGAANTLFTTPDFGTDGPGPAGGVSYQLTNSTGGGFTGQDSGLNTTVGNRDIFLFTDSANPNIVWGVDSNNLQTGEKVFALYVDTDGHLWVAQFAAIAHNVDGSTPAAYDDEVSITNGLVYISATATDGDGDTAHAVSPAGLHINFQDDGPHAFAEAPQDVLEGSAPVTGQLDFDPGADGATVTEINGVNLSFGVDGYSQAIALAHGSLQVTADGAYKFVAQPDDVYKTGGPANFTYTVTDGDGDTSASTVSFVVTDDSDPTKVTLNDVTVNEGVGTATISASVDHAPQGSNLVLTLSNGATITILNGQTTGTSTPFAVQGDDPYVDHETYPVSVTGATGGNYELLDTTDTSTVTVNDTITTNFVTLDNVVVFENQTFVYTAHMDYASLTSFTVTLNNGVNITFAPGQFTAMSAPQAAQGEDVYVDGQVIPVSIAGTSGGNFEAVNTTTYGNATVTFKDTIDPTKVTLNDVTVNEGVGTATISASVDHAPQGSNLVLTLSNGATITILNGQTTGTSTPFAVQGDDPYVDHETYPVSVTGATGGNYELLDTTDTGDGDGQRHDHHQLRDAGQRRGVREPDVRLHGAHGLRLADAVHGDAEQRREHHLRARSVYGDLGSAAGAGRRRLCGRPGHPGLDRQHVRRQFRGGEHHDVRQRHRYDQGYDRSGDGHAECDTVDQRGRRLDHLHGDADERAEPVHADQQSGLHPGQWRARHRAGGSGQRLDDDRGQRGRRLYRHPPGDEQHCQPYRRQRVREPGDEPGDGDDDDHRRQRPGDGDADGDTVDQRGRRLDHLYGDADERAEPVHADRQSGLHPGQWRARHRAGGPGQRLDDDRGQRGRRLYRHPPGDEQHCQPYRRQRVREPGDESGDGDDDDHRRQRPGDGDADGDTVDQRGRRLDHLYGDADERAEPAHADRQSGLHPGQWRARHRAGGPGQRLDDDPGQRGRCLYRHPSGDEQHCQPYRRQRVREPGDEPGDGDDDDHRRQRPGDGDADGDTVDQRGRRLDHLYGDADERAEPVHADRQSGLHPGQWRARHRAGGPGQRLDDDPGQRGRRLYRHPPGDEQHCQPYRRQRVREPGDQPGDGDDDDHRRQRPGDGDADGDTVDQRGRRLDHLYGDADERAEPVHADQQSGLHPGQWRARHRAGGPGQRLDDDRGQRGRRLYRHPPGDEQHCQPYRRQRVREPGDEPGDGDDDDHRRQRPGDGDADGDTVDQRGRRLDHLYGDADERAEPAHADQQSGLHPGQWRARHRAGGPGQRLDDDRGQRGRRLYRHPPGDEQHCQPYRRQRVREPGDQPGDGDDDDHRRPGSRYSHLDDVHRRHLRVWRLGHLHGDADERADAIHSKDRFGVDPGQR
ncbi:hypothetical protein ABIF52_007641 [Bradyrhizobium japonicum]